ncbi:HlyD family efflux transporter periplasmic adaptor subunit [Psychrobacter sp. B38]|uniref:HlyD family efflux transporter periplasmic adaptor subunit n=1 Tax=Psychrobacter sp. B38 TaxID=3143538 RepID=UPI003211375D
MTASRLLKTSAYLLSAFILAACQPPSPTDEPMLVDDSATVETAETPLVITDNSVTMGPDHILSIKPSRYQPSIGLQGDLEPVKQINFVAANPVSIEEVLVTEGQLVEKGMPLLIVRRLATQNNALKSADSTADRSATKGNESTKKRSSTSDESSESQKDHSEKANLEKDNLEKNNSEKNTSPKPNSAPATPSNVTTEQTTNDTDVSPSDTAADDTDSEINNEVNSQPTYNLVTVRASFKGRVEGLNIQAGQTLAARTLLLQLNDERQLYFVAKLPIQAEPQLSIGQTVNFTNEGIADNFTGQVSKLTVTSRPKKLLVYVDVIENKASRTHLSPTMRVTGRVDYGQIDVGTIVPERALHDVDLTELQTAPYKPLRPLTANVWIIGQDQRLVRRPIEVVEYNPTTKQYLIAGISNDSLICLADLPVDSEGKKVIVS